MKLGLICKMPRFIDISGKRFGRLVVIEQSIENRWGNCCWLCLCDCGKEKTIRSDHLRRGKALSCGCLCIEKTINRNIDRIKHGLSNDRMYHIWADIVQRCTNANHKNYKYYGGRGIAVCKRWLKFENFNEDMGEGWEFGLTIERANNNKGYNKFNCKWVTPKEQARNRRNNHLETYKGKTQCVAAWAEAVGIKSCTLLMRLRRGWSIEKALTTPVR